MDKIKFLFNEKKYSARVERKNNIVEINFESEFPSDEVLLSGFNIINEHNDKNMSGDFYHSFTTLYKINKESYTVFLSNDGSVYSEPIFTTTFYSNNCGSLKGECVQMVSDYSELIIPTPISNEGCFFSYWCPDIPKSGKITKDLKFSAVFKRVPTEKEVDDAEKQLEIMKLNIKITSLKEELASTDYIIIKSAEINAISDETLKVAQLSLYEENYPNLQDIINERISLREEINNLEEELNTLISE